MANTTYGSCPHCEKGLVTGSVQLIPRHDRLNMPYGPVSESNYRLEPSFWCSSCGITFKFPPEKPDAATELLAEERRRIAEVQRNW